MRYDRNRNNLDDHAVHSLVAFIAPSEDENRPETVAASSRLSTPDRSSSCWGFCPCPRGKAPDTRPKQRVRTRLAPRQLLAYDPCKAGVDSVHFLGELTCSGEVAEASSSPETCESKLWAMPVPRITGSYSSAKPRRTWSRISSA